MGASYEIRLKEAAAVVREAIPDPPAVAIMLGSGLSDAFGDLGHGVTLPGDQLPGLPVPGVAGHRGDLWAGRLGGQSVLLQRGRVHYYEGHSMADVVFSTRLFALLGVSAIILTNASGAIRPDIAAGDLVLLTDHINMLGASPLRGDNLEVLGPRFPDMSAAYTPSLRIRTQQVARALGIPLKEGVYVAAQGPAYETPAEIRAFRAMGADVVGMSTVPEAIAAAHAGLQVLGLSLATNLAAGVNPDAVLSHQEVIQTTASRGHEMRRLILGVLEAWPPRE